MKKDIYKITNNINGKIYIGQSKRTKRRFKEHSCKYSTSYNSKIHNAIMKYGIDNFTFEVLEHDVENYNEREKYWISYFKSNDKKYGYNITDGGEDPPISYGENSSFCVHPDELVQEIQNDIINTNIPFYEIANKFNVRKEYVWVLNQGLIRKIKDHTYPLRKQPKKDRKTEEEVSNVIYLLEMTTLSFEKIASQLNMTRGTVSRINDGKNTHCPIDIIYPIRNDYEYVSTKFKNILISMLKERKLKFVDIAKELGVSRVFISRFNNGKIYKQDNIEYPIRKSCERVY